jgi:hypothetical protein
VVGNREGDDAPGLCQDHVAARLPTKDPALVLEGAQGVSTRNHWQVRQPRPRPLPSEP